VVWPLTGAFLVVDLAFLGANLVKVTDGGWFPLVAGGFIFAVLSTWKRGREALARSVAGTTLPLDLFLPDLERHPPHRIPGTAVFMTSDPNGTPGVLLHHLKHNKVLHERVLIVSIGTEEIPTVAPADRITVRSLGNGIHQIVGRYGFMETPNVPALLAALPPFAIPGPRLENAVMETSYYLGRETLLPDGPSGMPRWRKRLFIILARNAQPASAFFGLPPNRVVEMGGQVQF
jgi:KUP system potassium uptake protein